MAWWLQRGKQAGIAGRRALSKHGRVTTLVSKGKGKTLFGHSAGGGGALPRPSSFCAPSTPRPHSLSSDLAPTQLRVRRGSQEAEAQPSPRWLVKGASQELSETRAGANLVGRGRKRPEPRK